MTVVGSREMDSKMAGRVGSRVTDNKVGRMETGSRKVGKGRDTAEPGRD